DRAQHHGYEKEYTQRVAGANLAIERARQHESETVLGRNSDHDIKDRVAQHDEEVLIAEQPAPLIEAGPTDAAYRVGHVPIDECQRERHEQRKYRQRQHKRNPRRQEEIAEPVGSGSATHGFNPGGLPAGAHASPLSGAQAEAL